MREHLTALVLAAGLALAPAARAEPDLARGHALVERNCGVCHAVGRADTSANPAAPAFRELHRRYPVDNLAEALAEGILTGHPQMPEFAFPPEDVSAIIAYLKSIQTHQGVALGSGPATGRR